MINTLIVVTQDEDEITEKLVKQLSNFANVFKKTYRTYIASGADEGIEYIREYMPDFNEIMLEADDPIYKNHKQELLDLTGKNNVMLNLVSC